MAQDVPSPCREGAPDLADPEGPAVEDVSEREALSRLQIDDLV